ncbi:MAG TPA: hypothetical protein V6D47_13290 [Oscillatoriaceae cyanobacterium]
MAQINAANWSNVPTNKAPTGNYFAQGSAPASAAPNVKLAPDVYISATQAPSQVQPASVQPPQQNNGLFGVLAGIVSPIAAVIGGVASAIGGAVNSLLGLIPSNPPLKPTAPNGPQLDPAYVAQVTAKATKQYNQSGFAQICAASASSDVCQQVQDGYVQQAVSQDEAARTQAAQLASDPKAATQTINGLYQQALGRNPQPDELNQAIQSLAGGTTPQEIAATLQQSPEAQLRAAYIQIYGHDFPSDEARNWYMGELAAKGLDGAKKEMASAIATYKQYNLPY